MSGYVGDLSPEQERLLQQFRDEVAELPDQYETSDHFYLQWLRARCFQLDQALEMYQKHLKWRKELKVDTILDDWEPPEVLEKHMPRGWFGLDRDGDPVIYEFFGHADSKGLYNSSRREDVIKMRVRYCEQISRLFSELSEQQGRLVDQFTVVCNMEGLSYQRHFHWPSIQILRELFVVIGDNYPERTKRTLVIHAPRVFPVAYNMVSRFIDERSRSKIMVCGREWKEQLQKYIAPDQLPEVFGGTRREPDPRCSAHLVWGGDVPREYFLINLTGTKKEDMQRMSVRRGSTHQVEVDVDIPGTAISWEFVTDDFDIGFGVFLKPVEKKTVRVHAGEMTTVVASERKESHVIPETGIHHCEQIGTYVLRFDNTYSWLKAKEVFYTVRTHPPSIGICEASDLDDTSPELLSEELPQPNDAQPCSKHQERSSQESSSEQDNNSEFQDCLDTAPSDQQAQTATDN